MENGLIQVYTGAGKGKTTAALGLMLRAVGHGFLGEIIQFQKGSAYMGELFSLERLHSQLKVTQFGYGCKRSGLIRSGFFHCEGCGECFRLNRDPELSWASQGLEYAGEVLAQGKRDLVVLDEISYVVNRGMVEVEEVLEILRNKAPHTEVVLTGRNMPQSIIEAASLVTEFAPIKHPMAGAGIQSRRGIEY